MTTLKRLHIIELLICLVICLAPIAWSHTHTQHYTYSESLFVDDANVQDRYTIHNGVEVVNVKEVHDTLANGDFYLKHYDMPNGDTVVSGSLRGKTNSAVVLQSLHIKGSALIHYYKEGAVETEILKEGKYSPSLFLIDSEDFDIACYIPKQYLFVENDCLEYVLDGDGYLKVTKKDDGFDIDLITGTVKENGCSDFMLVYSKDDLMDWESKDLHNTWLTLAMDGDNRWTYTGFYRISPSTYEPYGDNIYYRCQACYFAGSIIKLDTGYRVLDDMLCCIADVMEKQQNSLGYFPSTAKSLWLYDDFGINAGYYDTRFNSDLMEIFLTCYKTYGNNECYFALQKYINFFENYALTHGVEDGNGGLYIPDYWQEGCDTSKIHTSLNHQIAEINLLYELSSLMGRQDLAELGNRMLKAILNTGMAWVKADGSFEYAIYPDGTFGLNDYNTLTYNDMFKLQQLLEKYTGTRNALIDEMMARKLVQMQRNGITGYYQ